MKRREFLRALGGAAAALSLEARADQAGRPPTIGFLGANKPSIQKEWVDAFVKRLNELGWVEGRSVTIEYRWAEGRAERSPALIAELVKLKVGVIVTHGTANVAVAKRATTDIPIVFAAVSDPVGNKLVTSLAQPGGNITGLSNEAPDLAGKRLELLREVIPNLRRVGILANIGGGASPSEARDATEAARNLGLEVAMAEIQHAEEIEPAIRTLKDKADALYVQSDPLFNFNRARINTLAVEAHLPTVTGFRAFVAAGGLMAYGPDFPNLFRRAAEYVDKILRGAKPSDLPVEQPTKFSLVINLKTAEALGMKLPPLLLGRADELIE